MTKHTEQVMTADEHAATVAIFDSRCDRCGALCHTVAQKSDYTLVLCGHHTRQFADALRGDGWALTSNDSLEPVPVTIS